MSHFLFTCSFRESNEIMNHLNSHNHKLWSPVTHNMSSPHHGTLILIFLASLILILNDNVCSSSTSQAKSKVHIVYLGRTKHHDPELITNSHHEILTTVLGSKEASARSIVYSYTHGFSGFVATLTKDQAQALSGLPHVRLSLSKTYVGKPVPTNVAYLSSGGPSLSSPEVLKPDIAGPGVKVLGAVPPSDPKKQTEFAFLSGTSMATPHVAGIVALLKSLHSDWSPAAIKSAIVTTGWTTDPYGEPIFAEGDPTKLADPFDFGGGIVNPNRAADPGLVYDMGTEDYIHYLCTSGYNNSAIFQFTEQSIRCPTAASSILDMNLPSITISSLQNSTSLTREVTNVGAVNSTYKASIKSPAGITITVKPDTLIFNSEVKTAKFSIRVSSIHQVNTEYLFGSLTWIDGVHEVRTPVSVRTMIKESYVNDN